MVLGLKFHHISSIRFPPITTRKPQTLLNPQFQARRIQQRNFSRFQLKSSIKNPNNNGFRSIVFREGGERHTARDRSFVARVVNEVEESNSNGGGGGGGGGEDPVKQGGGGGDADGDGDEMFNLRWLMDPDREYMGPLGGTLRWVCVQVTWHLFSAMKETLLAMSWTISASGQVIISVATTIFFCLCVSFCLGLYFWL